MWLFLSLSLAALSLLPSRKIEKEEGMHEDVMYRGLRVR